MAREPLASVDYISAAHPETLQELESMDGPTLISLAIRIGDTRLIDNLVVGEKRPLPVLAELGLAAR
jgi:pantoate--beta-alanine ligase